MPNDQVIGIPEPPGGSPAPDDWLADQADFDWSAGIEGATGSHPGIPGDGTESDAADIVRRRRIVAGAVAAVAVAAAVAIPVVVLGGGSSSDNPPTTSATTTTTPVSTTPPPVTTTPPPVAKTPASPRIVLPARGTLRTGDHGAAVKKLQQALAKLGLDPGKADGVFGPRTVQAVAAFQEANNLANDAIVGAKTAAKINAALSGLSPAAG